MRNSAGDEAIADGDGAADNAALIRADDGRTYCRAMLQLGPDKTMRRRAAGWLSRAFALARPLLAAGLLAHSAASQAALGALPEAFDAAGTSVVPSVSSTVSNYVVRDTTLTSGAHVREYISTGGVVFAVTWDGPVLPDLKALLGKYFPALVAESERVPRAGRSHVAVNLPEVIIHSGGHMRAFEGSAWLPAALPAGFSADDVR